MSRLLAITLVVAAALVSVISLLLATAPTTHVHKAVAVFTKSLPAGKVTICVVVSNKKLCADPTTRNIIPVALMLFSKIPSVCLNLNVTLASGREVNLCEEPLSSFQVTDVYVLLGLTNKTEVSPLDYNITGLKVLKVPIYEAYVYPDHITAVFAADVTENITFNEVGPFYSFKFGPVMIAHWVLPQIVNVTVPDTIYVIVNFTGFARFGAWPAVAAANNWFYTMYASGGAGGRLRIVIQSGSTTQTLEFKTCVTYGGHTTVTGKIHGIVDTATPVDYLYKLSYIQNKPFNLTVLSLGICPCTYTAATPFWHWGSDVIAATYSLNVTAPRIGAEIYGLNIGLRVTLVS